MLPHSPSRSPGHKQQKSQEESDDLDRARLGDDDESGSLPAFIALEDRSDSDCEQDKDASGEILSDSVQCKYMFTNLKLLLCV